MSTSAASHPILVEHLTKHYGQRTVVDDLTFTVEPGRVTGFLGPNGSGKSTTMKMMLDLAAPSQGRAVIGGLRYRDMGDHLGFVAQISLYLEAQGNRHRDLVRYRPPSSELTNDWHLSSIVASFDRSLTQTCAQCIDRDQRRLPCGHRRPR